jgi:hypothetical protein
MPPIAPQPPHKSKLFQKRHGFGCASSFLCQERIPMIGKAERKEAAREFKERKPCPGIYALRCHATGRSWVDSSLNLDAAQNSQFFQLRQGLHRDKELQAEWNSQGGGAFAFEVLEIIPEDTPALLLRDLLSKRKRAWADQLRP